MRRENILKDYPIYQVPLNHSKYPPELKKLTDAPSALYFRGILPNWTKENLFAMVGTRKCSDYGKEIAYSFAKELSQAGLIIISGMARGIDTFSHKGTLATNARTIAVLGTGLDEKTIYPQENLGLAKEILEKGGCLLSEYPPTYPGNKYTFPHRNRIISALSLGTLVVESKYRSGSLITARHAIKQGKKVMAIPGSIFSQNSQGPHFLISQGATLVEKPSQILKELELSPTQTKSVGQINRANPDEQQIIKVLDKGSLHIEKIIEQTNLAPQKVSSLISLMEIKGIIKSLGANVFIINH